MTWKSHRAVTFVTVFVLTNSIFASVCASLGSTFPDRVEGPNWESGHRTYSHWFVLYLPLLFWAYSDYMLQLDEMFGTITGKEFLIGAFFWYGIGCICHILEDAICGRVPFYLPTKKVRLFPRLFYVGTSGEYTFVFLYCLALILFNIFKK